MKPFAYLRDPLFLVCLAIYFLNRWVFKPYLPNSFSRSYLNDLICIPFWLPIMLFVMRKVGWRKQDEPPTSFEILIPFMVWSCAFEVIAPNTETFRGLAFGDPMDIPCYTLGGLLGAIVWRLWYQPVHYSR